MRCCSYLFPFTSVAALAGGTLFMVGGCNTTAPPTNTAARVGEQAADTSGTATADTSGTATEVPAVKPLAMDGLAAVVAAHKGQAVLVDFWATWCVPCRKQFPHTVHLSQEYVPGDLAVVAVSMDERDSEADVNGFLAEQAGRIEAYISAEGATPEAIAGFGITDGAVPHYQVYDRTGTLVASFGAPPAQAADPAAIDKAVAAAVATSAAP